MLMTAFMALNITAVSSLGLTAGSIAWLLTQTHGKTLTLMLLLRPIVTQIYQMPHMTSRFYKRSLRQVCWILIKYCRGRQISL